MSHEDAETPSTPPLGGRHARAGAMRAVPLVQGTQTTSSRPGSRTKGKHAAPKAMRMRQAPAPAAVKPQRRLKTALIALFSIVAVVGAAYLAGVAAFTFLFLPGTTLDGADVSLKLASDVSSGYAAKIGTYQTQVSGNGLSFTLRGSDIGLAFDEGAYERGTIAQQDAWRWPLELMKTHTLEAEDGVTFSADKLAAAVQPYIDKVNEGATKPVSATVAFDDASQQYAVVPERAGTELDPDAVLSLISDRIGSLPGTIPVDDSALVQPEVKSDDPRLSPAAANANRYLSADIPLTLGGQSAGEVTRAQISQWIVFGDDLSATLDTSKLAAWAKSDIADKYDTAGAARAYTRPDGKQVTVNENYGHSDDIYGWITDEASLVDTLTQAIESGSTQTVEIPTKKTAGAVPDAGKRDWGSRYIDVDLSEQHARFYGDDGSIIWESDFVSGDHSKGYDTPTGVYALNGYRDSGNVKLTGATDPKTGQPSYISYVEYWMPFIGNSWAFHDATWRSKFGGNIYQTGGSHGCLNLPPDKAAELFNLCKVGDVVVVHN
ncbi:L,D-transpeptidase family protein [uncultured Parolsenella sp.]|uniref:L,D-transpeptidase n=1 Tax=uncultured Parolsenella sp. TaxID=2083008 RepID=UPI0027D951CA|nr:L,D-transpeptidase family protein [uncultured Parolsenella sp.]